MYTDNQMIKGFKRHLKETGKYNALVKNTNIMLRFENLIRRAKYYEGKNYIATISSIDKTLFAYNLGEYYEFMYQLYDGKLQKEIITLFQNFVNEHKCEEMLLDMTNRHLQSVLNDRWLTYWSNMYKHQVPHKHVDNIPQLVENKKRVSPYDIIAFLYNSPSITLENALFIAQLHEQWFDLLRDIAKQRIKQNA